MVVGSQGSHRFRWRPSIVFGVHDDDDDDGEEDGGFPDNGDGCGMVADCMSAGKVHGHPHTHDVMMRGAAAACWQRENRRVADVDAGGDDDYDDGAGSDAGGADGADAGGAGDPGTDGTPPGQDAFCAPDPA